MATNNKKKNQNPYTPVYVLSAIAAILIVALKPVIVNSKSPCVFPIFLGIIVTVSIGFLCFVEFYPFPADIDPHNMESGLKNAYTLLGSILGMVTVYIVDQKWLKFSTKAIWWAQIIKVAAGLGIVLAVKSGLKAPLEAVFGVLMGRAVRYYLIVIVAGVLWPMTFKWFAKLGTKE